MARATGLGGRSLRRASALRALIPANGAAPPPPTPRTRKGMARSSLTPVKKSPRSLSLRGLVVVRMARPRPLFRHDFRKSCHACAYVQGCRSRRPLWCESSTWGAEAASGRAKNLPGGVEKTRPAGTTGRTVALSGHCPPIADSSFSGRSRGVPVGKCPWRAPPVKGRPAFRGRGSRLGRPPERRLPRWRRRVRAEASGRLRPPTVRRMRGRNRVTRRVGRKSGQQAVQARAARGDASDPWARGLASGAPGSAPGGPALP
jgi:hypothetical protein